MGALHQAEVLERENAELRRQFGEALSLPESGARPSQTHCTDCGRRMVWDGPAQRSWMCPACCLRRMDAAEKALAKRRVKVKRVKEED